MTFHCHLYRMVSNARTSNSLSGNKSIREPVEEQRFGFIWRPAFSIKGGTTFILSPVFSDLLTSNGEN
jgi:hypothetical protein